MTHREQLAWAAGFFDGEGNAGIYGSRTVRARIGNTDLAQLQRFMSVVRVGKIYGPYRNGKGIVNGAKTYTSRPIYFYWVSGFEDVQHLMCLLWSWLSQPKRDQFVKSLPHAAKPKRRAAA